MILILHVLVVVAAILRVLLRPHRDPGSRLAWIVVILALPFLGALAYVLLGETSIGRKRVGKMSSVMAKIPDLDEISGWNSALLRAGCDPRHESLFQVGVSVSSYPATTGNRAQLMANSDASIAGMVWDIDAAIEHVHLLF